MSPEAPAVEVQCAEIDPDHHDERFTGRCVRNIAHEGSHSDGWFREWWTPRLFVCAQCDASTGDVVTETRARDLGFWTMCGEWFCRDCTTFTVVED